MSGRPRRASRLSGGDHPHLTTARRHPALRARSHHGRGARAGSGSSRRSSWRRNESPFPPLPEVAAGDRGGPRRPQPLPGRRRARAAAGAGRAARRGPGRGRGQQRLVRADPLAGQALLDPGTSVVHADPSFALYPHLAAAAGAARGAGAAGARPRPRPRRDGRGGGRDARASSSSATRTTRPASTARPTRSSASSTRCPRTSRSWSTRRTSTSSTGPTPGGRCPSPASGRTCW